MQNIRDNFYHDLKFYKTAPAPCPYLSGKLETKILTNLGEIDDPDGLYANLLQAGFRRSQSVAYRPLCAGCNACQSTRILVNHFKPSKTHRRILRINQDLYAKTLPPHLLGVHYQLYEKYIQNRHPESDMATMSHQEIQSMVDETMINTVLIEYRHQETDDLYGWALTDLTTYGPSMVYSVYDPEYPKHSLGSYMILDHIEQAVGYKMPYVFLGYWVAQCGKMAYKTSFKPFELYIDNKWC